MNPFTLLVLPQNDTPENRKSREEQLAQQQALYQYDYPSIVDGLPMARPPFPADISLVWVARLADVALTLGENLVDLVLPNVIDFDLRIQANIGKSDTTTPAATPAPRASAAKRVKAEFVHVVSGLDALKSELAAEASRFKQHIELDVRAVTQIGKLDAGAHAATPPHPTSVVKTVEADVERVVSDLGTVKRDVAEALRFKKYLEDARTELSSLISDASSKHAALTPDALPADGSVAAFVDAQGATQHDETLAKRAFSWLEKLLEKLGEFLGTFLGIYGRAADLRDYDRQFSTLPLPWPAGVYQTDEIFAQMRVAGPNPLVLRRATSADLEGFSLDDARLRRVTGEADATVERALAAGAFYVADYQVLGSLVPGTNPLPKYVFTPRALFDVPSSGRRGLRPIAIQTTPGQSGAVCFPGDGTPWEIAKVLVNMADGNYHELISHLGLTHLLTEPFVLATYRQLDPEHPLYALLTPHFAGTLLINYAAQTSLITDGGAVDLLLTGTIESARTLSAAAVKAVRYNGAFLPQTFVDRGVADADALPDYPYRDDALALWSAIHAWVSEYVLIYYQSEDDVTGDPELQAWVKELSTLGKVQDIGEGGAGDAAQIKTTSYLAKLLTQVIFTASVQHATVNFPQRTIMGFTPAMPLAAYASFPAKEGAPATQMLDVLPPLQQALLQQAVGTGLGGVYYTTLGQYGGELALRQVGEALRRFQARLQEIAREIHAANALGRRTPYTTLLPSVIPQSINI